MRDTLRLRAALHIALAAFPLGAALPSLAVAAEPAPDAQPDVIAAEPPPPPPPQVPDISPRPYPMPSCPSGEVTLTIEQAQAAAAAAAPPPFEPSPPFLDCPALPSGIPADQVPDGQHAPPGYAFVRIDEAKTQAARDGGEPICVYSWVIPCPGGRLLAEGTEHVVAALTPGDAWADPQTLADARALPSVAPSSDAPDGSTHDDAPSATLRRWLAQAWLDDARIEHASIASFARATLELMRLGAPPALVAATQRAALDEVRHAQRCFALAAAYADAPLQPAALDVPDVRALDLPALAVTTFLEGCVGETIGTLAAERAYAGCDLPAARDALSEIAHDERDHAALAWATLRWALHQGGAPVADALRAVAAPPPSADPRAQAAQAAQAADAEATAGLTPADLSALRRHGRLTPADLHRAAADAWRDVITPTLSALGVHLADNHA